MDVLKIRFISSFQILFLTTWTVLFLLAPVSGADDLDRQGCTDHPMIARMPGFFIDDCSKAYDEMEAVIGKTGEGEQIQVIEGDITRIAYYLIEGKTLPSVLQILRYHENILLKTGWDLVHKNDDLLTAKLTQDSKDTWLTLFITDGTIYELSIAEPAVMDQEIIADDMYDTLNRDGFLALYINFDTGKCLIKEDSMYIIDQVVTLLTKNKSLHISIEGHTDNVGDASANRALSLKRANAVMKALIKKGIPATRLSARGWGPEIPVADNRIESGRSKNRRVEIVKQ